MRRVGNRCLTSTFKRVRRREAKHFVPSISPRTTGCMWMVSPASTAFATSSHHAASSSPEGHPDDPPQVETVGGLGNRKNDLVNEVIEDTGVKPYEGSIQFIHHLSRHGFKIGVVTSSQNCATVLKAAKLDAFFEVQVDGNMIQAQQLAGKPAPDTFLMAAKLLGVEPTRTVVVEDAISGVQAGSAGNFGLVIGVARKGNAEELKQHGAHLVVSDLGELVD